MQSKNALRVMVLGLSLSLAGCSRPAGPADIVLTGLVDAREVDVASKVPGRVRELTVDEGDRVEEGQLLLRIESQELTARLGQVQATVDAVDAKLRLARKGARAEEKRAAERGLAAARHQEALAAKMHARVRALLEQDALPQARYDEVELQHQLAQEQVAVAQARVDALRRGARDEEIEALEALLRQGRAGIEEVQAYEAETEQRAPLQAEVARVLLQPGELAGTGHPIVTLVDVDHPWGTFALREDLLRGLAKGDRIEVEVPALGRRIAMTISHLAPMGDFATWRATSERAGFDLRSFELRAEPVEPVPGLRPGMTLRWTLPLAPAPRA